MAHGHSLELSLIHKPSYRPAKVTGKYIVADDGTWYTMGKRGNLVWVYKPRLKKRRQKDAIAKIVNRGA